MGRSSSRIITDGQFGEPVGFTDKSTDFMPAYWILCLIAHLAVLTINRFLIVKALVGTCNKEEAGAFTWHCEKSWSAVDSSCCFIT